MNPEIINAVYKYIEVLYENNQRLIKIFGIDAIDHTNDGTKDILDLIQNIPRLIPYSYDIEKEKLYLFKRDGLLEYKNDIQYIKPEYKKILANHEECLIKVKQIRDKYEHILHNVRTCSCYTGNDDWFMYGFEVSKKDYKIESKELIALFKDLNIFYDMLISDMLKYAYENEIDHPFYGHLSRIKLLGFNKIYDSKLLYEIGKTIIGI